MRKATRRDTPMRLWIGLLCVALLWGRGEAQANGSDCKQRCSGMQRVCQNIMYCVQSCGLAGVWAQNCYRRKAISYAECSSVYASCYPRPAKPSQVLLGGTYRESCRECAYQGSEMCCRCPNQQGRLLRSCVPAQCMNPVSNCDGKLLCSANCQQRALLRGPYENSCTKCFFYRRSMCCKCRTDGGRWKTSCVTAGCQELVRNCEGRLYCAASCPNGSQSAGLLRGPYARTCRDCTVQRGQMCCRCRAKGSWQKYSCVPMSCKRPVRNCAGELSCGSSCD